MSEILEGYSALFTSYLSNKISVDEFQMIFLHSFKNESRPLPGPLFLLLDELFGGVDSYTSDPDLLNSNPGFYVNERDLRAKVQEVSLTLAGLPRDANDVARN